MRPARLAALLALLAAPAFGGGLSQPDRSGAQTLGSALSSSQDGGAQKGPAAGGKPPEAKAKQEWLNHLFYTCDLGGEEAELMISIYGGGRPVWLPPPEGGPEGDLADNWPDYEFGGTMKSARHSYEHSGGAKYALFLNVNTGDVYKMFLRAEGRTLRMHYTHYDMPDDDAYHDCTFTRAKALEL